MVRIGKSLLMICAFGALAVPGALAADPITVPTSGASLDVPVAQGAPFDWAGFYAGVHGVVQAPDAGAASLGAGVSLGAQTTFDFYLVGAEVAVQGLTGSAGETAYGQVLGRAGLVVTDDVVVYAAAGYGLDLGAPTESDFLVGGGLEVSVSDAVSLRAQYLRGFPAATTGTQGNQFSFGAAFHF